jgi:hypothetical protein
MQIDVQYQDLPCHNPIEHIACAVSVGVGVLLLTLNERFFWPVHSRKKMDESQ